MSDEKMKLVSSAPISIGGDAREKRPAIGDSIRIPREVKPFMPPLPKDGDVAGTVTICLSGHIAMQAPDGVCPRCEIAELREIVKVSGLAGLVHLESIEPSRQAFAELVLSRAVATSHRVSMSEGPTDGTRAYLAAAKLATETETLKSPVHNAIKTMLAHAPIEAKITVELCANGHFTVQNIGDAQCPRCELIALRAEQQRPTERCGKEGHLTRCRCHLGEEPQ